jgi:hypothetical protein
MRGGSWSCDIPVRVGVLSSHDFCEKHYGGPYDDERREAESDHEDGANHVPIILPNGIEFRDVRTIEEIRET